MRSVAKGRPWPSYEASERVREIAARKVAELARGDERLADVLARTCADAARRAFEDATPIPGLAFRSGRPK